MHPDIKSSDAWKESSGNKRERSGWRVRTTSKRASFSPARNTETECKKISQTMNVWDAVVLLDFVSGFHSFLFFSLLLDKKKKRKKLWRTYRERSIPFLCFLPLLQEIIRSLRYQEKRSIRRIVMHRIEGTERNRPRVHPPPPARLEIRLTLTNCLRIKHQERRRRMYWEEREKRQEHRGRQEHQGKNRPNGKDIDREGYQRRIYITKTLVFWAKILRVKQEENCVKEDPVSQQERVFSLLLSFVFCDVSTRFFLR